MCSPLPCRIRLWLYLPLLLVAASLCGRAQSVTQVGLRSIRGEGSFRALKSDASGNLYVLLEAADGVRIVKMNAAATAVLAEAHLGQTGDQAVALALNASGDVFVAGTSLSSGSITGTSGTSYPSRADTTTNSFVVKFNASLSEQWLTFLGSGSIAASAVDASASQVVVTGSIFTFTLPVSANGIQQQPLPGSTGNGFVESFDTATGVLRYGTYLSGANGSTSPTGIALDSGNNAFVVGSTTATGFPTLNALVPRLVTDQGSAVSGFLTKLTPAGDGFVFSTFVPGSGLDAIVNDGATGSILVSGNLAAGLFPLTVAQAPVAAAAVYQAALRIAADGSSVSSASLLAPGDRSTIAATPSGFIAAVSSATAQVPPLLPVAALQSEGSAFLLVGDANGAVKRAARAGGVPVDHVGFSSLPAFAGGVTGLSDGSALLAGGIQPTTSSALSMTERFDLAIGPAATSALPSSLRDASPQPSCTGSMCSGGAALLERLSAGDGASLLIAADGMPNLTVRNAGASEATNLQLTANGYAVLGTTCGATLPAGAECDIALNGAGPGSLTVSSSNTASASALLPATTLSSDALSIVPKELDFGITASQTPRTRTLTVANLTGSTQTFASAGGVTSTHFSFGQSGTTCTPVGDGTHYTLAASASCTITLQLAASASSADDGVAYATWVVGSRELTLTGYTQAQAVTLSATHIGFGRVYQGGLRSARYLYVSNGSDAPQAHTAVSVSPDLPFQLSDRCPAVLAPQSVCQIAITYASATTPSSDATTISVDGNLLLIDGETVPPPSVTGAAVNPNLNVSPASVTFAQPVVVTTVSGETESALVQNTGASPFALSISTTGDFTASTCPATLPGGASCTVTLRFVPSDAGTRQGLLIVTAGSSSPVYVTLRGTATGFLPVGSFVDFGTVPVGTPSVQWFKVSQSFASLQVSSSSDDYRVLLVEDAGYGYGSPDRSRFQKTLTGSCLSCYLGIQFLPAAAGVKPASLTIASTSGGLTQSVSLTGIALAPSGVQVSPAAQDFGSAPVGSSTGVEVFTVTNATAVPVTSSAPVLSGDFIASGAATGGVSCGNTLQPGESCTVAVQFAPAALGPRTGTMSVTTSAGAASAALSGYGDANTGLTFQPVSLFFHNVPSAEATQQTVTVTNTGNLSAAIGTPSVSDGHFNVTSACGTLPPAAQCTLSVAYTAADALSSAVLTIPVTTAPGGATQTTQYTLSLRGDYTADNAGLQIVPGEQIAMDYGAASTGSLTEPRTYRINNLSGKSLAITVDAPRQFPILSNTCGSIAAGSSCTVSVAYAPLLNADATGTLLAMGEPSDGSARVTGLAYLQGYGNGAGTLAVAGNFTPAAVIDFGQVASGQTATQDLLLLNQSASETITVRRIRADFPFRAVSNCGGSLAPGTACNVTLTYAPNSQTTVGGNAGPQSQTGVLTLESDAGNSPLLVDLAGRTIPAQINTPASGSPVAALTTSQGSLTFALGTVGSRSGTQGVTVTNTGTVALQISGVIAPPDFTATTSCGALAVGASCDIEVAFTPQSSGVRLGSLEIQSNASNALEYVSLLGTGTPAAVALTPNALAFGRVLLLHPSSPQAAVFTNNGAGSVTLGTVRLTGDFSLLSDSAAGPVCAAGVSVAPGASCVLPVIFTPTQLGTRTGTLSLASSATSLPLSVALSGIGVQPELVATPASLNFGDVAIGKSQTLAITLSNVSASEVDALQITSSSGDFTVASNCGPVTLNAGSSCSLNVTFAPTAGGTRTGSITVTSTDPASPLVIPLSGNGLVAGSFLLTVDGGSSASAAVGYGLPASYALAITPIDGFTGAVALTCTPQALVQYATCSITPSSIVLTNGTVSATATITTVSAVNTSSLRDDGSRKVAAVLCCAPFLLLLPVRRRGWRASLLLTGLALAALLSNGCGSGQRGDKRIRYAAPGTYRYVVSAASTTGIPVQQSVTLTLTIKNSPQ